MASPDRLRARARVAALSRSRNENDSEYLDAQRHLREVRLAETIRAEVEAWPDLTTEQLDRLAVLLRPASSAGGGPRG